MPLRRRLPPLVQLALGFAVALLLVPLLLLKGCEYEQRNDPDVECREPRPPDYCDDS